MDFAKGQDKLEFGLSSFGSFVGAGLDAFELEP